MSARNTENENDVKCTIGRDGKNYYFKKGKRISRVVVIATGNSNVECKRKVSTEKKRRLNTSQKKSGQAGKKSQKNPVRQKGKKFWVWNTIPFEIPVEDKGKVSLTQIIIPQKMVDSFIYRGNETSPLEMIDEDTIKKYGSLNLLVVDGKLNKAFTAFQNNKTSWGTVEWDAFRKTVYLDWLATISGIY